MLTGALTLWAGWTATMLIAETRHTRMARGIPHRILVGGMRGKSTAVRLVHAGLLASGLRAISRTTGDAVAHLLPDGSTATRVRHAPANIREMRRFVRRAAALGCDTLCAENMAVDPALARLVATHVVRPTCHLHAFDALDHTEHFPADPVRRAEVVVAGWCDDVPVVLADSPRNAALLRAARARNRAVTPAPPCDAPGLRPFARALAGAALAVLGMCGAADASATEAVLALARESQRFTVYRPGAWPVVDLLSANDPDTVREALALLADEGHLSPPFRLLYLHRADRPGRLDAFAPLLSAHDSLVAGDPVPLLRRRRLPCPPAGDTADALRGADRPLVLVGNRHSSAESVVEGLAARSGVERW